ncbi:MAG: tRNA lysidine(34) synthetase TilS [Flavobacteriaceae bacterium]|nr:tRNA lysidine(34) synthetase TilS [Flavobacteriaceae bacterium]
MLKSFAEHTAKHFPFLKDKKLLLAISGGIDSVVLANLFKELNLQFSLAHCNFKLRGDESESDEVFVKKLAENLQVPVYVKQFETETFAQNEKLSIQVAARNLRYEWFYQLKDKDGFDLIVTAHHADDNLETFLINLIRGTGLDGLTGIPEQSETIIRPLLPFTREQIETYAKKEKIQWREDSSNIETKYLRNKIRHQIIPLMKELNPNFLNSFNNTLNNLKGSAAIVRRTVADLKNEILVPQTDGTLKIDIEYLKKLGNETAYLYELLREYGFTEWQDITSLLDAQSGKYIFSDTHQLVKDRGVLLLGPKHNEDAEHAYTIPVDENTFEITGLKLSITDVSEPSDLQSSNPVFVDKDLLKFPLTVRKWKDGDYFYPIGMEGKKKLSKYFKDEKLSRIDKQKTWLLCSGNTIVWVIGKRLDNRYKITDKTRNILKIEYLA